MKVQRDVPFDPTVSPTFWVNHASRALMREFERALRPLGFGMAYLPVLVALAEDGTLLQKDLAQRARVEQPTMAALLTRMERDGLIRREKHPTDGRAVRIALTSRAEANLADALDALAAVAERATSGFDPDEKSAVIALMQRMLTNLGG
jgi:MarR family transcriptional regulator for hemolysin